MVSSRSHRVTVTMLAAVLCLGGCGQAVGDPASTPSSTPSASTPAPPTGLDERGIAAWELWQQQGLESYTYRLSVECFCPALDGVEVVVRDGEVVRLDGTRYESSEQDLVFGGRAPTIDNLFVLLGEKLQQADEVTVRYDDQHGVPTSISVDHMRDAIDDEMTYRAADVQPL